MRSRSAEVMLAPSQDGNLSLSESENGNEKRSEIEIEEDKREENADTGRQECLRRRLLDRCALPSISEASCEDDDNDIERDHGQESDRSDGDQIDHQLNSEEQQQQGQEIPADRAMIVAGNDVRRIDHVAQNNAAFPAREQPVAENRPM